MVVFSCACIFSHTHYPAHCFAPCSSLSGLLLSSTDFALCPSSLSVPINRRRYLYIDVYYVSYLLLIYCLCTYYTFICVLFYLLLIDIFYFVTADAAQGSHASGQSSSARPLTHLIVADSVARCSPLLGWLLSSTDCTFCLSSLSVPINHRRSIVHSVFQTLPPLTHLILADLVARCSPFLGRPPSSCRLPPLTHLTAP